MRKIILALIMLLAVFTTYAQRSRFNTPAKVYKVAMLEPTARDGNVTTMQKEIIRGALEETITSIDGYQAFTRTDVDQITKELKFQQSGMVDDEQRKRLGAMSGADLLCVIAITVEEADFFVKCSLIDVETGEIIRTATQLMPINPRDKLYYGCVNLANYLMTGEKKAAPATSPNSMSSYEGGVSPISGNGNDILTANSLTKDGVKAYYKFNYPEAFEYFRKAVDYGSLEALYRLSYMYAEGQGVKRDTEIAFGLMLKAAKAGYTSAFMPLGKMYEEGQGTSKNKAQARSWYLRASAAGNEAADNRLNNL